jgi:pimeloyl-ACP methyl ester carboxylesterase
MTRTARLRLFLALACVCVTVCPLGAAAAKEKKPFENTWITPGTPPPLTPGEGLTVSCPEPLPQGTAKGVPLDNQKESFHIRLPARFDPKERYGVVVFISGPQDEIKCPVKWQPVLDAHKLIFVAPQNAGNKQPVGFRDARAVASALLVRKYYHLDPTRTYVAGYSGGARVAGMSAFFHPDLWRGTIQSCGADFYKPVPRVAVTDEEFKKNPDYGGIGDPSRAAETKANVRFVFVTGPGDFRNHYIKDIYEGGYKPNGFKALLIDVPEMRHQTCDAESLEKALAFIEGRNPAAPEHAPDRKSAPAANQKTR